MKENNWKGMNFMIRREFENGWLNRQGWKSRIGEEWIE